jgi:3-oxoacyl-[acyl-carrier protein] reductase
MRLENKVAVITGGARGIGRAIAEAFAVEGAIVYAMDVMEPESDFPTDKIKYLKADVTSSDSVKTAIDSVIAAEKRVDILVNNAGITRDNLVMRMSEDDWDRVLTINLKGAFICSKAVVRQMMGQRSGRIINMGSVVGVIGNAGQANYSASKAGMIGLTKSMAKELGGRNILVNLIAPGFVKTAMTDKLTDEQKQYFENNIPLKRGAEPADIANAAIFLASDDSSYITGQVLHVDGGLAI